MFNWGLGGIRSEQLANGLAAKQEAARGSPEMDLTFGTSAVPRRTWRNAIGLIGTRVKCSESAGSAVLYVCHLLTGPLSVRASPYNNYTTIHRKDGFTSRRSNINRTQNEMKL